MHIDVIEIRDFYASALGQMVRRHINERIRRHWPHGQGLSFAGIGYASPYLRPFLKHSSEVVSISPGGQGGLIWPKEGPLRSMLVDEDFMPIGDQSFDRVIEIHGLEFFSDAPRHLEEVWRILRPEGRLLMIVPNRTGLWARLDKTPFGFGQPFSRGQVKKLLVEARFSTLSIESLVHFAPFEAPLRFTASPAVEKIGAKLWPRFSGMLMIEAVKEVMQPIRPAGHKAKAIKTPLRAKPIVAKS